MTLTELRHLGVVVISPSGRIDSTTSSVLDAHLVRLAQSGDDRIVIDFAEVDYISSAGLRVMLTLAKRVRGSAGALALCGLEDAVRQVFELAGFMPLFTIAASREDAIQRAGGA